MLLLLLLLLKLADHAQAPKDVVQSGISTRCGESCHLRGLLFPVLLGVVVAVDIVGRPQVLLLNITRWRYHLNRHPISKLSRAYLRRCP